MSTFFLTTHEGQGASATLYASKDLTGATVTVEFSPNSRYSSVSLTKSPAVSGRAIVLNLSAADVATAGDSYFRVKTVAAGQTNYIIDGKVDFVPAAAQPAVPAGRVVSIPFAATVTPNSDTSDVVNVGALTGAVTIANPLGTPKDGQTLRLRVAQDATGSRVITWGANYAFGTDVTKASLPTTANAKWEVVFVYNATDSKWRAYTAARGF